MTAAQKAALALSRAAFENCRSYLSFEFDQARIDTVIHEIDNALTAKEPEKPETEILGIGGTIYLWAQRLAKIEREMQNLPGQIQEQGKSIITLSFSIEEQRYNLQRIENENLQSILSAKQEGRPVYSNEKARQIALEELLLSDNDYQGRKKKLGSDLRNLKDAELHFEYLNNKLKTALALSGLVGVK